MKRPYITQATCNNDLTVELLFSDHTARHIDIGDFIRKRPHPQYNKYLRPSQFRKMRLENGNIIWGNDLEFHLEDLYSGDILQ